MTASTTREVSGSTLSGDIATGGSGGIYNAALRIGDNVFSGKMPDNIVGFCTDADGNTFG